MPPPNLNIFATTYSITPGPNRRVTTSQQNEARSKSAVAVNPANPSNMICASKKFYDRANTCRRSGSPTARTAGTCGTRFRFRPPRDTRSSPGWLTQTWRSPPTARPICGASRSPTRRFLRPGHGRLSLRRRRRPRPGRPWPSCTTTRRRQGLDRRRRNHGSHRGTLYAVWGANTPLRFARSKDKAETWKGVDGWPRKPSQPGHVIRPGPGNRTGRHASRRLAIARGQHHRLHALQGRRRELRALRNIANNVTR